MTPQILTFSSQIQTQDKKFFFFCQTLSADKLIKPRVSCDNLTTLPKPNLITEMLWEKHLPIKKQILRSKVVFPTKKYSKCPRNSYTKVSDKMAYAKSAYPEEEQYDQGLYWSPFH